MLADLIAHPGVLEYVAIRGRAGIMALHGGLEPGTFEIASRASERAEASLYAVVLPDDLAWHVPSTSFHPDESPGLRSFLEHVRVAVSLHGHHRRAFPSTILLGGSNRSLAGWIDRALRNSTEVAVQSDVALIPEGLRGTDPRNPVNLPRLGGVQMELPPTARTGRGAHEIAQAIAAVLSSAAVVNADVDNTGGGRTDDELKVGSAR